MKRTLAAASMLMLSFTLFITALSAASVDAETGYAIEKMTADYIKKYPATGMKRGICVLPFTEDSQLAKELGLGTTLRDIVSGALAGSQVFFIVDRETLESRMKEMELSMSGMVDEKGLIQAGRQAGVSVFMTGSVSEIGDEVQVTLKLVDSETGVVVTQGSFRIPRSQMVKKHEQVAYGYIAQHGIGINWQTSYFIHPAPMESATLLNDFFVSYRPELWLNIKLGATLIYLEMWDDAKIPASELYPNYIQGTLQTGYTTGKINQTVPYIGVEYNYLVSPAFSIELGAAATIFLPNTLKFEQIYNGNPSRATLNGTATPVGDGSDVIPSNTMVLTQTFDTAIMFRVEIKPQYFISPRAAIGLYLAAIYTTPLQLERVDFGDGTAIYPNDSDGAVDPNDKHLGFNAKQMGLDKNGNVEEDLALFGGAVGISASFYF